MSKPVASDLSTSLVSLIEQFTPHVATGVNLSPTEVSNVILMLATMQRFAVSLEQEVNVHRLGEANRLAGAMVEDIASNALGNLLVETDGKIIRPRFGRDNGNSPA